MNKPISRHEMFMSAIANGCECSLEPVTREEQLLAAHAKREAGGGGGTGGVTSWNDLEDKPFYANKEFVEVVPLQSVTKNDEDEDIYRHIIEWLPKAGKQYRVLINGNEYICATQEGEYETYNDGGYAVWIGNATIPPYYRLVPSDNTGEPFLIDSFSNTLSWKKDLGETITIQITEEKEIVKTLDPKYVGVLGVVINRNEDWSLSCNRTFEEVSNALNNGIPVVATYSEDSSGGGLRSQYHYNSCYQHSDSVVFGDGTGSASSVELTSDNEVSDYSEE